MNPRFEETELYQERLAEVWNRQNIIGVPVTLKLESGDEVESYTASEACVICGQAVVKLGNYSGCFAIEQLLINKANKLA